MKPFVLIFCAALGLSIGCGDDDEATPEDSGGTGGLDAAAPGSDAAIHDTDAQAGEPDAGDGGADPCLVVPSTAGAVLDIYGMAWGEGDADKRICMLSQALTADAVYQDPMGRAEGIEELSDTIGMTLTSLPNANIEVVGEPDLRDGEGHFAWSFKDGDAELIPGEDFVEFADDGRLSSITGFFGPFTEAAPEGAVADLLQAWNTTDDTERQMLLADVVTAEARYTDGNADAVGPEAIASAISGTLTIDSVYSYGDPTKARAVVDLDGDRSIAYVVTDTDDLIERLAVFEGEL